MEQDTRPEAARISPPSKEKAAEAGDVDPDLDAATSTRARARATCAQCAVAGAVFLLSAGAGFPIGYSAVASPQLRAPNSSLPTDNDMGSWIASIHSAATPVGAFASGMVTEKSGRRAASQSTASPFFVGWASVASAQSHAVMSAGRAVAGLAVGLSAAPAQVSISEVAEPRNRGASAGTPMVSYSSGISCVYASGSVSPWRVVAWSGTASPSSGVAASSSVPESPTWSVRRGRSPQASKASRWSRGGSVAAPSAQREFEQLVARLRTEEARGEAEVEADAEAEAQAPSAPRQPESCSQAFSHPDVYKPFFIVVTLNIMQIFSGTYLVIFYAVDLLAQANAGMDEFSAAVSTAAVRVVFTAVACGSLSWTGRRPSALSSGSASGSAAVAMGTALYVRDADAEQGQGSDPYAAIVVGCLLVYMAANTCGFFVSPLITIGESLPAKVRGLAGGYIFASFNLASFAATKVFPSVTSEIGAHGVFWIFGVASLTGTVFIYLASPETKGQSLAQIEDYFRGKNFLWVTRHKYQSPEATKV